MGALSAPDALADGYAGLVECWAVGGDPRVVAPREWLDLAAGLEAPAAELLLVAVASQFSMVALRPALPADAVRREPLPRLAAPCVPEQLRPVLRAALSACEDPEAVIRMVLRRGFAVHPADWFPGVARDHKPGSVPDLYLPWTVWAAPRGTPADDAAFADDAAPANLDGWRSMAPQERLSAMRRLRQEDPPAVRLRLAEMFQVAPARERLALLGVLGQRLEIEDAEFLESLESDRSSQVRIAALDLLARLGRTVAARDGTELAACFQVAKNGILRRRIAVTALQVPSQTAAHRVLNLFRQAELPGLAAAMALSADELIDAWDPDSPTVEGPLHPEAVNRALADVAAATGSDSQAEALALKLVGSDRGKLAAAALFGRIGQDARAKVVRANLRPPWQVVESLAAQADGDLVGSEAVRPVMADPDAVSALAEQSKLEADARIRGLLGLATMMTPSAAEELLGHLERQGLHRALPTLSVLVLNSALAGARSADADDAVTQITTSEEANYD
ncbi:MAG: DUF5691 domain-containing protein [Bifidobacteriaceae bacterium]|jgi:hypothetical protein|nr:DUF5691 domain-containing protein [Bifidobacteriaceae bacterium]